MARMRWWSSFLGPQDAELGLALELSRDLGVSRAQRLDVEFLAAALRLKRRDRLAAEGQDGVGTEGRADLAGDQLLLLLERALLIPHLGELGDGERDLGRRLDGGALVAREDQLHVVDRYRGRRHPRDDVLLG